MSLDGWRSCISSVYAGHIYLGHTGVACYSSEQMLVHMYFEQTNSIYMAFLLMFYVQLKAKDEDKNLTKAYQYQYPIF
jgi:hypothetical protein